MIDYNLQYDVVLIHPPAIYDFRKRPLFPGALATVDRIQYPKVAIGVLSIADYLDRNGYKVIIDNLADRIVSDKDFDVEEHLGKVKARVYAIGLHWHHHSQGAIEIARLCKKLHPESLVVIGGLTATCFHEEIIQKYGFVDAIIRGEAEKPFLEFMKALDKNGQIADTPNLTYRLENGEIYVTPLMEPDETLDEYEFTRFDLLDPQTSIFNPDTPLRGSLVVCRGCIHNCVSCGASAYSYKTNLGRSRPAFRSPEKIISDIRKLNAYGIKQIGLYQDPRMGGERYWKELVTTLRNEKLEMERLTIDLLAPADEEFIRELATIKTELILYICPDTGCEKVRKTQQRNYSNQELLDTIKLCHRYHIPVTEFFSVGLVGETEETMNDTWNLWDEICDLNRKAVNRGGLGNVGKGVLTDGPIMGPIIIEPGSLSFKFPERYGYKILYDTLEKYIQGQEQPSWHQWLNYETGELDKAALVKLMHDTFEEFILHHSRTSESYRKEHARADYVFAIANRVCADEIDKIMQVEDTSEREDKLESLKNALESCLKPAKDTGDPYSYKRIIGRAVFYELSKTENKERLLNTK
jgi:B12-binding domain/radical SAM domain protein